MIFLDFLICHELSIGSVWSCVIHWAGLEFNVIGMSMYVASKNKNSFPWFSVFRTVLVCISLSWSVKGITLCWHLNRYLCRLVVWSAGRNPASAKCTSGPEFDSRQRYIFPNQLYFLFVCLFVYLFIYLFIYLQEIIILIWFENLPASVNIQILNYRTSMKVLL